MKTIRLIGDSVLKGFQYSLEKGRHVTDCSIDYERATGMNVENLGKFGCTVSKGLEYTRRVFEKNPDCDWVLADFGGNDSDFNWAEIAANPYIAHDPKTVIPVFYLDYCALVRHVQEYGSRIVLTTLPPLCSEGYIDWTVKTQNLDRNGIMTWLNGDIERVRVYHYLYSEMVKTVSRDCGVPLIDLRSAFEAAGKPSELMGPDGIHPNEKGQKIIEACIERFFRSQCNITAQ